MINIHDQLFDIVDPSEFWLLTHIVKRLNKDMLCFPSNKLLLTDTGWSIDKLQKVKKSLQTKGLIEVVSRFNSERQTSNTYYLTTNLIGAFIGGDQLSGWVKVYPPEKTTPTTVKSGTDSPPEKPTTEVLTINEVYTDSKESVSQKPLSEESFKLSNELQPKVAPAKNQVYVDLVDYWLKTVHPGWTFGAIHGQALKSIITKIRTFCKAAGLEGTDGQIKASFEKMIRCLPEWYKQKDLPVINSKFNEIITEIQNGGKKQGFSSKNSADRFSDFAGS